MGDHFAGQRLCCSKHVFEGWGLPFIKKGGVR